MTCRRSLTDRVKSLDARSIAEIDREIIDELEFHVEMRTLDGVRAGISPDCRPPGRPGQVRRLRADSSSVVVERCWENALCCSEFKPCSPWPCSWRSPGWATRTTPPNGPTNRRSPTCRRPSRGSTIRAGHRLCADRPRVVETFPANGAADVDPTVQRDPRHVQQVHGGRLVDLGAASRKTVPRNADGDTPLPGRHEDLCHAGQARAGQEVRGLVQYRPGTRTSTTSRAARPDPTG